MSPRNTLIHAHAAKLQDLEDSPVRADPLLAVQDRPARLQQNRQRCEQHDRQGDDQHHRAYADIERMLHEPPAEAPVETFRKDQPALAQRHQLNEARLPLEERRQVHDADPLELALEKILHGQVPVAPVPHPDNDLVDAVPLDERAQ